jgi:hypothetical protein
MGLFIKPHNFFVQISYKKSKNIRWKVSFVHNLLKNHTKLYNLRAYSFGDYMHNGYELRRVIQKNVKFTNHLQVNVVKIYAKEDAK